MLTRFSTTLEQPFFLSETQLTQFISLLHDDFETIDLTAACLDDTIRSFDSLNELLSYTEHSFEANPDPTYRRRNKNLQRENAPGGQSLQLRWFRDENNFTAGTEITIHAADHIVTSLRAHIENVVTTTNPPDW